MSQNTNNRHKKSAELLERARQVLAGGVSSEFRKYNYPHALFYTHGIKSRIYDVDNNEYVDFTLSQGPLILGHSHPRVLQAINDYSASGQLFAGQHIKELELAEKIQRIIPSAERLRFCLDGSEAVQTALRAARATTGKKKFLRFEGHYHGWLDNVSWGNAAPSAEALGDRENPRILPWSKGLPETAREEVMLLPWNDLQLVKNVMERHHQDIAAIITEPVMCNAGCIPPRAGFLEGLRQICDAYGTALIFDEVITGFRMGLGGAQSHFNVIPDMSVFAKAMASGYPISAIVGKQKWMRVIEDGTAIHAGTMNSGNGSVAAALATIEVLQEENPYERLYALGNELMEGLRKIAAETGHNFLVQGVGPMFHTGFTDLKQVTDYREALQYDKKKLGHFVAGLSDRGIRIINRGLWYISTAHTAADIELALRAAREVMKEMT